MATILVATDGSETAKAAARAAFELARAGGDDLLFVAAWHELRGDFGIPLHELLPELVEVDREWANETLVQARAEADAAGLPASVVSRHGDPVGEICAVARERSVRMIVIGSHGWGPLEGALFGSVSWGVLRHSPCPVLVVPNPTTANHEALPAVLSAKEGSS